MADPALDYEAMAEELRLDLDIPGDEAEDARRRILVVLRSVAEAARDRACCDPEGHQRFWDEGWQAAIQDKSLRSGELSTAAKAIRALTPPQEKP